jgi:hypothetical protein
MENGAAERQKSEGGYAMKRICTVALMMLFFGALTAPASHAGMLEGSWIARADDGRVKLTLVVEDEDIDRDMQLTAWRFERGDFRELERGGVEDTRFEREAGTLSLHGTFDGERGLGQFEFEPNEDFERFLRRRGIRRIDDYDMLHLFVAGCDRKFIEDLEEMGYGDISDGLLVSMAIHGVSADYIREMRALGYDISLDKLIAFRIHGIDRDYVRELKSKGIRDMSADEILSMKIHGVSAEYIDDMQKAGFDEPVSELLNFKIHGVTPEFAEKVRGYGYEEVTSSELVQMRIHGVNFDFIEQMNKKVGELVQFRIHGVTPEYIDAMSRAGIGRLSASELVQFRIHGVTPEFIREIEKLGFKRVSGSELVQMRIHGVSPKFIREIREAGFEDIPISTLVEFRIHGVDADYIEYVRRLLDGRELTPRKVVSMKIHGI